MTEREYNTCVEDFADNVYRFILKNLQHEEDARDIVQSAYEKLWVNRSKVDNLTAKSYLFTIAYHLMIDHIRKSKRIFYKDEWQDTEIVSKHTENYVMRNIQEAFTRLNETQKSLVMLKDYEGYNYEEIGKIMELSTSQVKVYLHRARLLMKKYIGKPENII